MSSAKRGRSLAEVMAPLDDLAAAGPPAAELAELAAAKLAATDPARGPSPSPGPGPSVVPVNVLVAPEDRRRLRQLSLDSNLSLQRLGHEAWNLLLQKRGLPPLKPVTANVPSGRAAARSR